MYSTGNTVIPQWLQGIGSRTPSDTKIHDAQVPYIKWNSMVSPPYPRASADSTNHRPNSTESLDAEPMDMEG